MRIVGPNRCSKIDGLDISVVMRVCIYFYLFVCLFLYVYVCASCVCVNIIQEAMIFVRLRN